MSFDPIMKIISFFKDMQSSPLFTWKVYPLIVIAVDVSVAFSPMKNIISQLPISVSPYFPIIAISALIVFLEVHFGQIRQDINKNVQDPNVPDETRKEILNLIKYFIFIIPVLVLYEGIMQCVNYYELGEPFITYISVFVKYLALAFMSFVTHRILFLFAHKCLDYDNKKDSTKT